MKLLSLAVLLSLSTLSAFAQEPRKESVSFKRSYLPQGFDSNDRVQIIVEGTFKNTCYKPLVATASVDHRNKVITVSGSAYVYQGMCIQMMVPFHQVITFTKPLAAGTYTIVQAGGNKRDDLGHLKIAQTKSANPDDYLYAPVSQAYFSYDRDGTPFIRITGYFTSSCMSYDKTILEVQDNVIVVQPLAKNHEGKCDKGRFKFTKSIDVKDVEMGRYLLHVRSLNGEAINTLVDIDE